MLSLILHMLYQFNQNFYENNVKFSFNMCLCFLHILFVMDSNWAWIEMLLLFSVLSFGSKRKKIIFSYDFWSSLLLTSHMHHVLCSVQWRNQAELLTYHTCYMLCSVHWRNWAEHLTYHTCLVLCSVEWRNWAELLTYYTFHMLCSVQWRNWSELMAYHMCCVLCSVQLRNWAELLTCTCLV